MANCALTKFMTLMGINIWSMALVTYTWLTTKHWKQKHEFTVLQSLKKFVFEVKNDSSLCKWFVSFLSVNIFTIKDS